MEAGERPGPIALVRMHPVAGGVSFSWSRGPGAGWLRPVIYLDHNATTPVRPEVFGCMRPFLTERWRKAAVGAPHGFAHGVSIRCIPRQGGWRV